MSLIEKLNKCTSRNGNEKFDHLVMVAKRIGSTNPRALPDFVNLVLRPLQAEANIAVAECGTDAIPTIEPSVVFGEFIHQYLFNDEGSLRAEVLDEKKYQLSLAYHVVLPWPWNLNRYIDNLCHIGRNKHIDSSRAWEQDYNHSVCVWLPWGIGFVNGGNHSIMTGVAAAEGTLKPSDVYDCSYLLSSIHTDGVWWFDTQMSKKIERVKDYRTAAVFEIGRLMEQYNCTAALFLEAN